MPSLPESKVCSKCKVDKSIENYYLRGDRESQVRPQCKQCESNRAKNWYQKNQTHMAEYREKTKERKAAWSKQYGQTEKAKQSKAKTREKNKEKRSKYNKAWREKNKEKAAQHWRNRRARLLGVASDNYSVQDLLELYGDRCHFCKNPIDLEAPRKPRFTGDESFYFGLHIDHIVPLVKGGDDTIQNVRPAHAICNLKKGTN